MSSPDRSPLAQLQRELQRSIVTGDSGLAAGIVADGIDAATRVGVYSTAYRLRLIDALAANFPRLRDFLGGDAFAILARDYLDRYPSQNVSVRWFGHRLAEFLRHDQAFAAAPWVPELAQWEWDIAAAFDATDVEPIELQALNIAAEDWPQLRFELHPSVRLLSLQTAAVALFRQAADAVAGEVPELQLQRPQAYVIWRQGLDVRYREQSDDEAHALTLLSQGGTFEAMCAGLCDWVAENEVPTRAASLLKTWVLEGLIASVVVEP
jgi:hypothetical protein